MKIKMYLLSAILAIAAVLLTKATTSRLAEMAPMLALNIIALYHLGSMKFKDIWQGLMFAYLLNFIHTFAYIFISKLCYDFNTPFWYDLLLIVALPAIICLPMYPFIKKSIK